MEDFWEDLKYGVFFHLSWLLWSTVFSPTVTGSSLSMNTNNLADIALISASAAKWVKKDTYSTQDIKVILLMCFVTFFFYLLCNIDACSIKACRKRLTWHGCTTDSSRNGHLDFLSLGLWTSCSCREWVCDPWEETLKISWAQSISAASRVQENWEWIK